MKSDQFMKPKDMIVAFAIPTTRQEFIDGQSRNDKQFAKRYRNSWERYCRQVIKPLDILVETIEHCGCNKIDHLTLGEFGRLCSCEQYKVIIVFAHGTEKSAEFADGMASIPDIVKQIPPDLEVFLHFAACNSASLATEIKRHTPNCRITFHSKRIDPAFWIIFYNALIEYLYCNNSTYPDAFDLVRKHFISESPK